MTVLARRGDNSIVQEAAAGSGALEASRHRYNGPLSSITNTFCFSDIFFSELETLSGYTGALYNFFIALQAILYIMLPPSSGERAQGTIIIRRQ